MATEGNDPDAQSDERGVLPAVLAACVALWSLLALIAGIALDWPTPVLGCLAAVVVTGAAVSTVIFRVIHLQRRG